jgi:hypothetical protein
MPHDRKIVNAKVSYYDAVNKNALMASKLNHGILNHLPA